MSYDIYTKQYLDLLNELKDEIDQRSDQPLDKLFYFILEKANGSPVIMDLLFAMGLMKAPERFFVEIRHRSGAVYLTLRLNDGRGQVFIWADTVGEDKIDDQRAREVLLSRVDIRKLKVPGCIKAAEEVIKTCKVERIG